MFSICFLCFLYVTYIYILYVLYVFCMLYFSFKKNYYHWKRKEKELLILKIHVSYFAVTPDLRLLAAQALAGVQTESHYQIILQT